MSNDTAGPIEAARTWVTAAAPALHGVASRTDASHIAAELVRLNDSVRRVADARMGYADQPGDYAALLLSCADSSNLPAGPQDGALPPPAVGGAASIAQAAARLRRGETSAVALAEAALQRARATQPTHNAFLALMADRALAQARELDREAAAGRWRGPLHGIPMAHKDCFDRTGLTMTVGGRVNDAAPATQDATVLARLRDAGAVDLGALNLNEMVCGPTGQNPHHGDCANAWDAARIAGGSSSGSAVAVAQGSAYASLGSDTGGSIRLPAAMNGLFGLKPTYGRVSRAGSFPRAFSLDAIGPLARTAGDCALLLGAISGHDPRDPSSLNAPVPDYAAALQAGWARSHRVGVLRLDPPCDPGIDAVFRGFTDALARHYDVDPAIAWPQIEPCYALGDVISKVEAATLHSNWMRTRGDAYSQAVFSRTEPGLHVPAVRYLEALALRARVLQDFLDGPMRGVDVLVCPTVPLPVPLRTEADMEKPGAVFGVVAAITRLTRAFSYLGVPVLTMPIGLDANGMPVGAQLIARPLGEARLLALAHALSQHIGWPRIAASARRAPQPFLHKDAS
ncbi:amidase [Bordetella sp. BOR01]|uniref:amidase n=1 Tax=Bordetella sp. BOR01 TaxID=2854779 RepID=UPI001C4417B9|nr:amidase [Bordetella sp. BOR01]MBV7484633.1 amidase [Bordetella sp. BOR01]